jgi:hypothetical protein
MSLMSIVYLEESTGQLQKTKTKKIYINCRYLISYYFFLNTEIEINPFIFTRG